MSLHLRSALFAITLLCLTRPLLAQSMAAESCATLLNELAIQTRGATLAEFDQTPGSGWRALHARGCFKEAADLIAQYQARAGESSQLRFHQGQMLALSGAYKEAVDVMQLSLLSADANRSDILWNDYVLGVIAFLKFDYSALSHSIQVLYSKRSSNERNLVALLRLAKSFGSPYKEAVSAELPANWDPNCYATSDEDLTRLSGVQVVMLGEIHGTVEVPRFAGALACQIAAGGQRVILALEMPAATQESINEMIASKGRETQGLLESRFWSRSLPFGVSSGAMFDLLLAVSEGRLGRLSSVVAFDPGPVMVPEGARPDPVANARLRSEGMARNLENSLRENPDAVHLVVVGRAHAIRRRGNALDRGYAPLGFLLSKTFNVFTFTIAHSGGQAWVCTPSCGATQFDPLERERPLRRGLVYDAQAGIGFDGLFYVGRISESPPQRTRFATATDTKL